MELRKSMVSKRLHTKSFDIHLFHEGQHFEAYKFLGARQMEIDGIRGIGFRTWAPNAKEISVVGDFNNWKPNEFYMHREEQSGGIWSIFISGLGNNDKYKFHISTHDGREIVKSDPFAFYSELRPGTASMIKDIDEFNWTDEKWLEERSNKNPLEGPMNIYELHLGSWRRDVEDGKNDFMNYRDIADELVKYMEYMNYTHVEIMPVNEHPLDASWGYQATGFFSVTSRFGEPDDFKYFVNKLHEAGLALILDWVPGHFCKDAHGLYQFDGAPVYEYDNPRLGENDAWGTANFDLSKQEVHSFLISNAMFWFREFHIDGLRVDAVANMLYLDYQKDPHHELKNHEGGNENLWAVGFLRKLNANILKTFPGTLMMAEESTAWPHVTGPAYMGGLGFNYKWNMGWMNDMLEYMEMDPIHRKWHHDKITFSLMYAMSENFVLPFSHDEVVHGKKSMIGKMPGFHIDQFSSVRTLYGYMFGHPGKKLLFQGSEIGQFLEWRFYEQSEWHILDLPNHKELQTYMKDLNYLYKSEPAMWEVDHSYDGFSWIDHSNYEQSIISFMRKAKDPSDYVIIISNFTPLKHEGYRVGVPEMGEYVELLNSDDKKYGGWGNTNSGQLNAVKQNWNNQEHYLEVTVPPLSTIFIKKSKNRKLINNLIIEQS